MYNLHDIYLILQQMVDKSISVSLSLQHKQHVWPSLLLFCDYMMQNIEHTVYIGIM